MRILAFLVLLLAVGCGPGSFVGTWIGTITAGGPGGSVSYSDTWSITQRGSDGLQIFSTQTCTNWPVTEGMSVATWSTTCGGYPFSGSIQFVGQGLQTQFTMDGPNGESVDGTGTLAGQ